jgi:hypothetical protein
MTIAEIHGKLPEYEGMEDLLTSDVFSTFKYLPVELAFIPFLKRAVNFRTGETINYSFDDVIKADYIFWPKTSYFKREPDLLILLTRRNQSPISIVVEAKYRSGKSNVNRENDLQELQLLDGDQLAEQYYELVNENFNIDYPYKELLMESNDRFLLFVTAHDALPKNVTNETEKVFHKIKNKIGLRSEDTLHLYWVNWQAAWSVADEALNNEANIPLGFKLMLADLKILLERKGLRPFNGFSQPNQNVLFKDFYFWGEEKMKLGKEIKNIYDVMLKICTEASHFISVVNDLFVKYGWNPVGGNGVMWDRSTHYAQPRFWLPYFQQRVFATEQDPTKGVGINIIFDEAYGNLTNTIPFVSCCYIETENSIPLNKCDEIYCAGWSETSEVLDEKHSKLYQTIHPNRMSIVNYFLPLDVLSNQQAVESYIIKPLIELYKGNTTEAYELIQSVCLTREELSS